MGYRDSNQAVPDPGTSNGRREPMVFRCQSCAWTVRDTGIATVGDVLRAARQHQAHGHTVTWKGQPQRFD